MVEFNTTAHRLLDVAEKRTRQDGFNAFSYKDLQKEVGIKTSSIHYYFPTKQDLALALVTRATDRFRNKLTEIAQKNKKGIARLESLAQLYTQGLDSGSLSLSGMLASDLSSLSEKIRLELQEFFLIIEMWVVKALTLAQDQHEIRAEVNPHKVAALWVSLLEGSSLISRLDNNSEYLEKTMSQAMCQLKN